MSLKKTNGDRIESKTLTSQLVRDGFDFRLTNQVFSEVALFFLQVVTHHPQGLSLGKNRMKFSEYLTIGDRASYPLPRECPSVFRRAAMNKAIGIYQSWQSNFERWLSREEKRRSPKNRVQLKRHKPPVLPTSLKLNATFYSGMYKKDTGDSVILKILVDGKWKWIKFKYQSAPFPDGWQKASPSLVIKSNGKEFLNWTIERYRSATEGG